MRHSGSRTVYHPESIFHVQEWVDYPVDHCSLNDVLLALRFAMLAYIVELMDGCITVK